MFVFNPEQYKVIQILISLLTICPFIIQFLQYMLVLIISKD